MVSIGSYFSMNRMAPWQTIADYRFFWRGKPLSEPCQHDVSFAVTNTLVVTINLSLPSSSHLPSSERISSLRMYTTSFPKEVSCGQISTFHHSFNSFCLPCNWNHQIICFISQKDHIKTLRTSIS